jgi:hypothetical protein
MSNWLSWLWCKWLVVWRMRDVSLLSHLWNLSFVIGWQPICHLLCGCLRNASILYKISHMRNALSSGELLTIITTMMGNMWSMVFFREFKGLPFFCANKCLLVCFYFWWIPMFKCQDGNLLFPLLWHVLHVLSLSSQFIFYFVSWFWILYYIIVHL